MVDPVNNGVGGNAFPPFYVNRKVKQVCALSGHADEDMRVEVSYNVGIALGRIYEAAFMPWAQSGGSAT
jgi:hypothetical protein